MWIVFDLLVDKLLMKSSDLLVWNSFPFWKTITHCRIRCTHVWNVQCVNKLKIQFGCFSGLKRIRWVFGIIFILPNETKWSMIRKNIFLYSLYAVERSFIPVWNDCNFFPSNGVFYWPKLYWLFLNLLSFNVGNNSAVELIFGCHLIRIEKKTLPDDVVSRFQFDDHNFWWWISEEGSSRREVCQIQNNSMQTNRLQKLGWKGNENIFVRDERLFCNSP